MLTSQMRRAEMRSVELIKLKENSMKEKLTAKEKELLNKLRAANMRAAKAMKAAQRNGAQVEQVESPDQVELSARKPPTSAHELAKKVVRDLGQELINIADLA